MRRSGAAAFTAWARVRRLPRRKCHRAARHPCSRRPAVQPPALLEVLSERRVAAASLAPVNCALVIFAPGKPRIAPCRSGTARTPRRSLPVRRLEATGRSCGSVMRCSSAEPLVARKQLRRCCPVPAQSEVPVCAKQTLPREQEEGRGQRRGGWQLRVQHVSVTGTPGGTRPAVTSTCPRYTPAGASSGTARPPRWRALHPWARRRGRRCAARLRFHPWPADFGRMQPAGRGARREHHHARVDVAVHARGGRRHRRRRAAVAASDGLAGVGIPAVLGTGRRHPADPGRGAGAGRRRRGHGHAARRGRRERPGD